MEGGRDGGREGGEGLREGGREGERERGIEREREGKKEGRREKKGAREGGREGRKLKPTTTGTLPSIISNEKHCIVRLPSLQTGRSGTCASCAPHETCGPAKTRQTCSHCSLSPSAYPALMMS